MTLPENLIYTNQESAGILRKKSGKGFTYLTSSGKKVTAKSTLKRIESLVIPPIWENVWITRSPKGHIQAVGYDQKGRKQYLYHPKWVIHRQNSKYERLRHFGEALPSIRKKIARDVKLPGWPKEKVLAIMVMILDEAFIRIGNLSYARQNGTYGLSTLRRKHVNFEEGRVSFEFKAKSGKYRKVLLEDESLVNLIKECNDLPGYELFRYFDEEKKCYCNLMSDNVNEYLREITGEDFSAKNFRTWAGSVLTVKLKPEAEKEIEENPRKKLDTTLVNMVADKLGNTVSICREYYIHPKVLECATQKNLEQEYDEALAKHKKLKRSLDKEEILTLHLLSQC
ncbi:DNA topoisomerase IB [Litoribacter alkaliphilus]|uniref:DNA topoisomerase n=1 Tax=Litoribacter ruber TaxID=702568 RepID=A0AAP2CKV4_9BACT|nr:DNA topoisomerase IB [Litoribacter alkaliphilus]MBS9524400.1 DNA topoisomerase IB [Litoribacter alkaliphilus]